MYRAIYALRIMWICAPLLLVYNSDAWGQIPLHHQIASGTLLDRPLPFRELDQVLDSAYKNIPLEDMSGIIRARLRESREMILDMLRIKSIAVNGCILTVAIGEKSAVIDLSALDANQVFDTLQKKIALAIDDGWAKGVNKTSDPLQSSIGNAASFIVKMREDTPGDVIARHLIHQIRPGIQELLKPQSGAILNPDDTLCKKQAATITIIKNKLEKATGQIEDIITSLLDVAEQSILAELESAEGWLRLPDVGFALAKGAGDMGGSVQMTCPAVTYARFKPVLVLHGSFNTVDSTPGRLGASLLLRGAADWWAVDGLIAYENRDETKMAQIGVGGSFRVPGEILFGVSILVRRALDGSSADYNPSIGLSLKGASTRSPILIAGASWTGKSRMEPLFQIIYPLSSLE